ncbi:hypothetical protein Syun_001453 [Stephania yunnanensis]|uniref:Uncharacterized protein n=1 Tax=Stephania yunnanensis TaxID=152371 RepID=A0AAP0Q743_9MAGN
MGCEISPYHLPKELPPKNTWARGVHDDHGHRLVKYFHWLSDDMCTDENMVNHPELSWLHAKDYGRDKTSDVTIAYLNSLKWDVGSYSKTVGIMEREEDHKQCAPWSLATNWEVSGGTLEGCITMDSPDPSSSKDDDVDEDHQSVALTAAAPLFSDSGPCEIQGTFIQEIDSQSYLQKCG